MTRIIEVTTENQIALARTLFEEYASSIGVDLSFQGFGEELRTLPGKYTPPAGGIFLAMVDGRPVGCVALRPLDTPGIAELKRMFVRTSARGHGVGLALARKAIDRAREAGYTRIRLDTLDTMNDAQRLYHKLGFTDIEPYTYNPIPGATYMEIALEGCSGKGEMERNSRVNAFTVRPESAGDMDAIREVNESVFETRMEAQLVDGLRARGKLIVSIVAESGGKVVAHIAFSPVHIANAPTLRGAGLGPMAVIPPSQGLGIGNALARAGLDRCRELEYDFVVVLGHLAYYPRFGFSPASRFGLTCVWPVPEGVFMAMELRPQSLAGVSGLVTYEPEFDAF
jgi:predicted N-acetyltransferase YhbS